MCGNYDHLGLFGSGMLEFRTTYRPGENGRPVQTGHSVGPSPLFVDIIPNESGKGYVIVARGSYSDGVAQKEFENTVRSPDEETEILYTVMNKAHMEPISERNEGKIKTIMFARRD
jgi:hypothetical protein